MTALMPESDRSVGDVRWQRVWEHRVAMLRIARRRCRSWHDAEDVVAQAMLAAGTCAVPDADLAPWLSRVVMNLSAESHRAHDRSRRLAERAAHHAELVDHGHEDHVVTRLTAGKISAEFARLPERQRLVLGMRSEGSAVTDIAVELGLPYKTVESLLSRARSGLRAVAKALAGLTGLFIASRRQLGRATWAAAVPAVAAAFVFAGPGLNSTVQGSATMPWAVSVGNSAATDVHVASLGARTSMPVAQGHSASPVRTPPHRARRQSVGPRLRPHAGPVSAEVGGAERRDPDEDLVQSIRRCITDRPEVTAEHIGCKES